MFQNKNLVKIPVFSPTWLFCSYVFLVFWELMDGITTKIGLNLGLAEVGTYAKGVLGNYGFWGLMVWKYSVVAAVGAVYVLFYYVMKKYAPTRLNRVSKILTVGCLLAAMVSVVVVFSNIGQIELALHS